MLSQAYKQQLVLDCNRINALLTNLDEKQLFEVFQSYLDETKVLHQKLILALQFEDWSEATNLCHQWKGAAHCIGLNQLAFWLQQQEINCRNNLFDEIVAELDALVATSTQQIFVYLSTKN